MKLSHRLFPRGLRRRILHLLRAPMFWWITVFGNLAIFGGAYLFYHLESGSNPKVESYIDALIWAVGIVTTVGGGEAHPMSFYGKILSVFMMMGGAIFLWSYMALFVGVLVDPDLEKLQREINEIQHDLKK